MLRYRGGWIAGSSVLKVHWKHSCMLVLWLEALQSYNPTPLCKVNSCLLPYYNYVYEISVNQLAYPLRGLPIDLDLWILCCGRHLALLEWNSKDAAVISDCALALCLWLDQEPSCYLTLVGLWEKKKVCLKFMQAGNTSNYLFLSMLKHPCSYNRGVYRWWLVVVGRGGGSSHDVVIIVCSGGVYIAMQLDSYSISELWKWRTWTVTLFSDSLMYDCTLFMIIIINKFFMDEV